MTQRDERIIGLIKEEAAKFLQTESSGSSLMTVTNVSLSTDGKRATIFFTVFPEEKEKSALDFTKRKRTDFQNHMREETRLGRIPFFDFEIDEGEKNRQKIDSLSGNL